MLVSKYIKKYRTQFSRCGDYSTYSITGTYAGIHLIFHQSLYVNAFTNDYDRHFIPIITFSNVRLSEKGRTIGIFPLVKTKLKEELTQNNLSVGDRIHFYADVRPYTKYGLYSGDLLSCYEHLKNLTKKATFKEGKETPVSKVTADYLWIDPKVSNLKYNCWISPGTVQKDILKYYSQNMDQFLDLDAEDYVRKIVSILAYLPYPIAACQPVKMIDTQIRLDGNMINIKPATPYQIIQRANRKIPLITPSKMKKLQKATNPLVIFRILVKGVQRAFHTQKYIF